MTLQNLLKNPLETAVLISLFTDKRHKGERGWWGASLVGYGEGSILWTMTRQKRNLEALESLESELRASLSWISKTIEITKLTKDKNIEFYVNV